jgi:hypothetical protein
MAWDYLLAGAVLLYVSYMIWLAYKPKRLDPYARKMYWRKLHARLTRTK